MRLYPPLAEQRFSFACISRQMKNLFLCASVVNISKMDINTLTGQVIGAAIEVHSALGPGLLESAYEECLCRELELRTIPFERQKELPIEYKGVKLNSGYRLDVVVANKLILELKACETLLPIHEAQLLTYLKLTGIKLGLLINFHVPSLKDGIKRLAN
jgi:GxxExxY protein